MHFVIATDFALGIIVVLSLGLDANNCYVAAAATLL
jgi:hypothetical protein